MDTHVVTIEKPESINFILGQSHFIKTVEDIHEALVNAVPGIKFGLAFCEASGACLIRHSGTDDTLQQIAIKNAQAIAGFFPINILKAVQGVTEVVRIYCATANPTQVIIAETEQGRGIMGVIDGFLPKGVEDDEGIAWRKGLLRRFGYKL
jgi:adenosine/AMP kinase